MRTHVGRLKTGNFDEQGRPIRLEVEFRIPRRPLNNSALELASIHESKGEAVALNEAVLELIRLCIVRIGDTPVRYADLENKGIDEWLTEKQQDTLRKAFDRLTTATKDDAKAFIAGLEYVDRDGKRFCRGSIPETCRLEYQLSPKNVGDEDEDGPKRPQPREVEFGLPNRNLVSKAQQNAKRFEQRSRMVSIVESNLNMIRYSVVSIDGNPVSEDNLRGDGVDDYFDPKEQSLLVMAFEVLMNADRGDVDDFLGTIVDQSIRTGDDTISTSETSTSSSTSAEE